jgi:hypothetical protein
MKFFKIFLVLCATVSSYGPASAATIPSFQVGGSVGNNSSSALTVTPIGTPDGNGGFTYEYRIEFAPQTLSVSQLFDVGNSGLAINDILAFAGGSVTAPLFNGTYVPFAYSNLVTFTSSEGAFSFDSVNLGLFQTANMAGLIPNHPISDGPLVAFSTGILNGPGGSSPADFMFFINAFSNPTATTLFGDVAWALYAPTVLPTPPSAVPEPTSLAIFGFGVFGIVYRTRRKLKT